jgi:hypothetical protein
MVKPESVTPSRSADSSDRRERYPGGLRAPGWLIALVLGVVAVLKVGWDARGAVARIEEDQRAQAALAKVVDARLCRIESAVHVAQWPTCPGSAREVTAGMLSDRSLP